MLRLRTSLGQTIPYQGELSAIAAAFPKCFTSSSILPILDKSISDGERLSRQITVGDGDYEAEMYRAVQQVRQLRNRFASEPSTNQYCVDNPVRFQTIQAISGIYQSASGISAAKDTRIQALQDLVKDLTDPNRWPQPLGISIPTWAIIAGIGYLGFNLYKNRSTVTVRSETDNEA